MRKFLLLFVAFTATQLFAQSAQKDPYQKTFIHNAQQSLNARYQQALRDGANWQKFTEAHGNWWVEFNQTTGMPHRAWGKPFAISGASPEEKAINFFSTELGQFNSPNSELVPRSVNTTDKYNYVTLQQQYMGLDVLWANATLRLSLDGKVVMFGLDTYNNVSLSTSPGISAEGIKSYAASDFTITVNSTDVLPELKVLPLMEGEAGTYTYKLVYEVYVNTVDQNNLPGKFYSLVDANSGEVYYRQNHVKACGAPMMSASLQANSEISDNPLLPTVNRGLPYLKVTIDGDDYYTDFNGTLNLNFITEPTDATVDLDGLYAKVYQGASGSSMESIDIVIEPGENTIEFDDLSGALTSEVSAYYQQNVVHDYMRSQWPTFDVLDFNQTIRVERTDGTCNAFYDGSSTNFYAEGGGCPSTALFDDVVMHEYGHGVNFDLYDWLGGSMFNGAMQEGYADIWAICNTANPLLGQGFLGGPDTYVRKYDGEPKVYPRDLVGEVHADGEIIAGAWWDVAVNFGSDVNAMGLLWNQTHNATIDGPDGNEGEIYRNVLLEALIADDDNADLTDGTPRYEEINAAFCKHGITLLGEVFLDHEAMTEALPAEADIAINADVEVTYPDYLGGINLNYRTAPGGSWSTVAMTNVSGTSYEGFIPAQPTGTIVAYYFTITDNGSCAGATLPVKADLAIEPNLPYYALVGYNLALTEDFDNFFTTWAFDPFDDDDAVTGQWDVNEPNGTTDGSYQVQTDKDHTSGSTNLCAFTGNASVGAGIGENDVDDGHTTLRTPIFDMSMYEDPAFTYWRYYSNAAPTSANPGNDVWQVRISNDMVNWVTVERTHTEDNSWRMNAIRVKDYVDLTETVAVIFIAQDSTIPGATLDGGSLVEAAIDDVQLWDVGEVIVDTPDAVNELGSLVTGIFPNPAHDIVNVYFSSVSSDVELSVVNSLGQIVLTQTVQPENGKTVSLNCAQLAAGVYTINCKTDEGYVNKRFVINR